MYSSLSTRDGSVEKEVRLVVRGDHYGNLKLDYEEMYAHVVSMEIICIF